MRLLYFLRFSSEGLTDIIVYTNPDDPSKRNRGFAFLEFDSHKSAANARRRLGSLRIFGAEMVVNWAEPQDEPDEEVMSKVRVTVDVVPC